MERSLSAPKEMLTDKHVSSDEIAKKWAKVDGEKREVEQVTVHPEKGLAVISPKKVVKDRGAIPIYRGEGGVVMTVWEVGCRLRVPLV